MKELFQRFGRLNGTSGVGASKISARTLSTALAVGLGIAVTGISSAFALDPQGAVVVGVSVPLTGDAATIGLAVKNGVELAYSELPPEQQAKIKLTFQDDQNSPKNAITAFTKLVKSDKADVIIATASNTSKATAPYAEREKIPQISIATDPAVSEGRSYVVNLWATAAEEAKHLVGEAVGRGYKNIAVVATNHDFSNACRKAFDKENAGRLKVVLSEEFSPDIRDFRSFLTKLRGSEKVDAIFVNLFLGQLGLFAKQARELGFNQPLFSFELFEDPSEVKNSNGALVGQWYSQVEDPTPDFALSFQKKFPGASTFGAANGHDALMLISAAIQAGKGSSAGINEYVHTVKDFHGALGTFSATGQNSFSLPATLKVVTEKGFEKLKK